MKKNILVIVTLFLYAGFSSKTHAQTTATTIPAGFITKSVAYAKELLLHLDSITAKLEKIKPSTAKDIETKRTIQQAILKSKVVVEKGNKLRTSEAQKYDTWVRSAILKGIDDCLTANPGSECCFGCKNGGGSGYGSFWCFSNCFVARFPDIN